ncbi:N-acetyltransferase [Halobellus salinus]|uniref:N-acetyltransferase n=1 Tax=Halobellus salinus TaxID=931585 RepID=A0A830EC57_9EURY|nr:GNAT family N-acetyltransferase [Halobellus salinus]GGJ10940.1 N-acetyltransferase [Halobellus salinus]SMP10617.1 phosphinothricin acetyltransferase [Halobellus salinus]
MHDDAPPGGDNIGSDLEGTTPADAPVTIRPARPDDASGVRAIYAPFVRDSPVTFRTEVPSVDEMAEEIRETRAEDEYPWYVAAVGSGEREVVGYAYAGRLRDRAAYRWAAETSVYVAPDSHRAGVGRRLYDRLLGTLGRQGYCSAYAAIATPNPGSVAFHESQGFERVGTFPASGFKLGEWHDVVWYHRRLNDPEGEPAAPDSVSVVDGGGPTG